MEAITEEDFNRLRVWYARHQRALPWRGVRDPYHVWVSEIMLQQTQTATVVPYYQRFLRRFPTLPDLAAADLETVLKQWEGLGYYRRARLMHQAARTIVNERQGVWPTTFQALKELPGLGDYTAAAIASIAFGQPVPAVDGNALRVGARYWGIRHGVHRTRVRQRLFTHFQAAIADVDPGDFNQAIMDLGATICVPRSPRCPECPLQRGCRALAQRLTDALPVIRKPKRLPHHHFIAGVIRRGPRVLLRRRGTDEMLGGLWEFPKIAVTADPTPNDREIAAQLSALTGYVIASGERGPAIAHAYSHFRMTATLFYTRISGQPQLQPPKQSAGSTAVQWKWIFPRDIARYPCDQATLKMVAQLHDWKPWHGGTATQ